MRTPKIERDGTPEYNNEFGTDGEWHTLYSGVNASGNAEVVIDDIRLIDNHVLWVQVNASSTDVIEVIYTSGL